MRLQEFVDQWLDVCRPKEETGLGIRNIVQCNTCLMLKLISNICTNKKDTLWVRWIHSVKLNKCSLRKIKMPTECSSIWRKMLKIRNTTKLLISVDIGAGKDTSFWFDSWFSLGGLYLTFPESFLSDLTLSKLSQSVWFDYEKWIALGNWTTF